MKPINTKIQPLIEDVGRYFGQIYKSIPLLMQSCMVCGGQPRKNPDAPEKALVGDQNHLLQ